MTEKEIEELVGKAIKDSVRHELGAYKVDKEQHYLDHVFLKELRGWYDDIRSSFWKSVVGALVPALLLLLLLGFVSWSGLRNLIGIGR